jgi:hypothetical protein
MYSLPQQRSCRAFAYQHGMAKYCYRGALLFSSLGTHISVTFVPTFSFFD